MRAALDRDCEDSTRGKASLRETSRLAPEGAAVALDSQPALDGGPDTFHDTSRAALYGGIVNLRVVNPVPVSSARMSPR